MFQLKSYRLLVVKTYSTSNTKSNRLQGTEKAVSKCTCSYPAVKNVHQLEYCADIKHNKTLILAKIKKNCKDQYTFVSALRREFLLFNYAHLER